MNDEIKEILDRINNYPEKLYCLNEKEKHLLLDYITNLQKTNKNHSKKIIELGNKITNLQQENQDLSRMCELYGKSLYNAELTDYKSRCEKATEITENLLKTEKSGYYQIIFKQQLNILQNGSEEDATSNK